MNEHDRKNLDFLLYSTEPQLKEWYANSTADDRDYAHELMTVSYTHLTLPTKRIV